MNNHLVKNWNACVGADDEIYILGDFAFGNGRDANYILRQLAGKKYLVKGNHDHLYLEDKDFDLSLFEWVKDFHILRHEHCDFALFHYPILEWPGFYEGAYHLYGHVHNRTPQMLHNLTGKAVNVGVDVQNFAPVSIQDILTQVSLKNPSPDFGTKKPQEA